MRQMLAWLPNVYDSAPMPTKRMFMNGYARCLHVLREGRPMERAVAEIERIDRADRAVLFLRLGVAQ